MSLVDSLAKAQSEMQNAAFNKINPHFKSKYADLGAIRDAVVPVLAKHGIALVQTIETHEGVSMVTTKLLKGDEEIVSSGCPIITDRNGPQAFGSALTYARRYSMSAIVGIASEEDDDAELAVKHDDKSQKSVEDIVVGLLKKGDKSRLDKRSKEICNDLRACTDQDQLLACWHENTNASDLKEMKEKMPKWYKSCVEIKDQMKANLTSEEVKCGGQL